MNPSPENLADLRAIRRYEKSTSALGLGLFAVAALTAPLWAPKEAPFDYSWAKMAPALPVWLLLAAAHFYHRHLLKQKADAARRRLALRAGNVS